MAQEIDMQEMMASQQPSGNILQRLLGGMATGKAVQEGGYQYTDYVGINDTYKGINDTYVPSKYVKGEYKPMVYETPPYEPAGDLLFGPARGEGFAMSAALKETGVGENLRNMGPSPAMMGTGMHENLFQGGLEESPAFKKTGVADEMLFGIKTPAFKPETGGEYPLEAPRPESLVFPATYKSPVFGPELPPRPPLGVSETPNLFGPALAPKGTPGTEVSFGPKLEPKGYIPPQPAYVTRPAVVTPPVAPVQTAPVAPAAPTPPTPAPPTPTEVVEQPLEEPAIEEQPTEVAVPAPAAKYVPQPVVRPRTQMEGKRPVGRPTLSPEEKARRKAEREAARSTGMVEMQ